MSKLSSRFRQIAFGVSFIAVGIAPAATWAETLADTLADAYRNSHLLDQNRALLRAADDDVAIALSSMLPTLDFVTNVEDINPMPYTYRLYNYDNLIATFQLQASITLYAGGRNKLSLDAQKETVLASREALRSLEQNVLLQAVSAYMGVLQTKAYVNLRENNRNVLQQELQATQDRFDVGEVTRTDVALAESALQGAVSQLAAAKGNYEVARETFRTAVGRYPEGDLKTPSGLPATAPSLKQATDIAVKTHPEIRQAQREVTVADIGVKIAQGAYKPTVSASVIAQNDTNFYHPSQTFAMTLSQPIYHGGKLAALERQALSQKSKAQSNLMQVSLEVEQDVSSAWASLDSSKAQIRATDEQIRAAQIGFDGTREEARLGARTTLDVLDAEQDLLDARASRIDAIASQYIAAYKVLSSMGLLTVDHLDLGIQTYDPAGYYNAVKHSPARLSPRGMKLDRVLRKLGKE